ncbi:hypothetical protein Q5P01_009529 [Channa striata]|uniref:Uncharacterized protein n=1 Tax=Channa striata TaxID=64152 RepID=A0AA88N0L8_CHASR|nr:hypothetical protein Q5P01_009529 [Channa striata]
MSTIQCEVLKGNWCREGDPSQCLAESFSSGFAHSTMLLSSQREARSQFNDITVIHRALTGLPYSLFCSDSYVTALYDII